MPERGLVLDRIQTEARRVFAQPSLEVGPETTHEDVDGWDSITHVAFIMALEKAFGLRFPMDRIYTFKDLGELAQWIQDQQP